MFDTYEFSQYTLAFHLHQGLFIFGRLFQEREVYTFNKKLKDQTML